jgi:hypothetical protein
VFLTLVGEDLVKGFRRVLKPWNPNPGGLRTHCALVVYQEPAGLAHNVNAQHAFTLCDVMFCVTCCLQCSHLSVM